VATVPEKTPDRSRGVGVGVEGPLMFFKEINISIYETTYETYMKLKSS